MISKPELKQIAEFRNLNLGQAEKSFFQDLILFIIYKKHAKELIFKGGTALSKCYGFDRFSEDLDFTLRDKNNNIKQTLNLGLKHYNVVFKLSSKTTKDFVSSLKYKLLIQGALYEPGNEKSLCSIRLDFSTRETPELDSVTLKLRPISNYIPMFDIIVMDKREIFAEKIRTVLTRNQARDLYDLYYLKNSVADVELINHKLKYYNLVFSKQDFIKAIQNKKDVWDKEMKHLVKNYPSFSEVKKKLGLYFSEKV